MKLARGTMLVVASHNSGKVREIKALLGPHGVEPISAGDLGLAEPEETGLTFAANAELKARAAADASGHAAIADDSGLCVAALGGDPGIYSARWAGPLKDFRIAMTRVEQALRAKEAKAAAKTEATYQAAAKTEATYQTDLSAKFVCALCVALPHGEARIFEGEVKGTLSFPPRGLHGFGYDPIFIADGMTETFGEIDPAVKHAMSHRARAFEKLLHGGLFPETM